MYMKTAVRDKLVDSISHCPYAITTNKFSMCVWCNIAAWEVRGKYASVGRKMFIVLGLWRPQDWPMHLTPLRVRCAPVKAPHGEMLPMFPYDHTNRFACIQSLVRCINFNSMHRDPHTINISCYLWSLQKTWHLYIGLQVLCILFEIMFW